MGKWFRQILQGEHSLFRLSLPFRVRLFNVLALVGGMISLINGISSYANNQDSVILGLNLGIAVLSFVLLFYAYKSGRYQFCYVVTTIMIFLMMFPYLFFKSGGYKGGMVSFYIFGILFTVFMLEGKVMFFTAFMEMVVYIATIMIAYQNPQMVVWFSSEKEVVMDLLIGFCASSISVAAVMYLHFRMYNKQQEILEEARIEAQSANKAKSAFLANMSHEIRTPLNAIVGFSSLLTETEDMKDRKQYMAIVQENTELLLQLISDILDLSKMESGAFEFVKSDTDVNLLCSEIIRSLRMKVPAGVELVFEECLPGCHVWADKNRLNQVISNFINNALKFTFSGSITLGYYRQTDGYLRFYVRDTGMGIPKNKIKKVFDRFVKLNSFVHGTGLGLSICKSLVEQMGGTIGVESEEGEGSCFWFTYPYQEMAGSILVP